MDRIFVPPKTGHGTRRYGKRLRCGLCGVIAAIDPAKPTRHQKQCPYRKQEAVPPNNVLAEQLGALASGK